MLALCINDDDRDLFLDESKWSEHVRVSEWFFKPKDVSEANVRRKPSAAISRRLDSRDHVHALYSGGHSVANTDATIPATEIAADAASNLATSVDQHFLIIDTINRFRVLQELPDDSDTATADDDDGVTRDIADIADVGQINTAAVSTEDEEALAMEADEFARVLDLSDSSLDTTLSPNQSINNGAVS